MCPNGQNMIFEKSRKYVQCSKSRQPLTLSKFKIWQKCKFAIIKELSATLNIFPFFIFKFQYTYDLCTTLLCYYSVFRSSSFDGKRISPKLMVYS